MTTVSGVPNDPVNIISGLRLDQDSRGISRNGVIRAVSVAAYNDTGAELGTYQKIYVWIVLFKNGVQIPVPMGQPIYGKGIYVMSANNFGPGNNIAIDISFHSGDILSCQFYQASAVAVSYDAMISGTYL